MATAGSLAVEIYTYTSSGTIICNGSGLKTEGSIFTKSELYLRHLHLLWSTWRTGLMAYWRLLRYREAVGLQSMSGYYRVNDDKNLTNICTSSS